MSARALAPLGKLLMLARPFFADDTVGLFLKGRETASEIEAASKDWTFESVAHVSRTDPDGRIVEVRQLAAR